MASLKKFIFILCLILGLTMAGAAYADETMIKVGLGSEYSATFSGENGLSLYNAATGELLYFAAPGESVTVSGGFMAGGKFYADIELLSVISVERAPISYNGSGYRGYFLLTRSGSGFTVTNLVHMDNYLYSVLGREMSSSFPQEALKAQAICAKNFVMGESGRHNGYDVCATTHCQVYSGVSGESAATRAAVDAVSGKAAYYNGRIVPLYFFATSGGATENVKNVWGSDIPYLQSVSDPFEPADKASRYTWTTTFTAGEIKDKLSAKGVNIGEITNITIDEITPAGRALTMTFHGTSGSHTVRRDTCRTILGLNSQWFSIDSGYMVATSGSLGGNCVLTGSGMSSIAGYNILSSNGIVQASPAGVFTFYGRGYGHGVGMSQWGAYGMAEQGYSYTDILLHYFTGIYIQ